MAALWERQPDEPTRAFYAFTVYRDQPPETRTLKNVADAIGHTSGSGVGNWSSRYNWVERVAAYDEYQTNAIVQLTQQSMRDYQAAITGQETMAVGKLFALINKRMEQMAEYMTSGGVDKDGKPTGKPGVVKAIDLLNMAKALETTSNMARRAVGLPTAYTSEDVPTPDYEGMVFYVGKPETVNDGE